MTIESVNPVANTAASAVLLQAMIAAAEAHGVEFSSYFGVKYDRTPQAGNVDVQVLVNGEPVPFMAELGAALKRITDGFETIVREKALQLIGLSDIAEKTQQVGRDLEEKLEDMQREVDRALKEAQNA